MRTGRRPGSTDEAADEYAEQNATNLFYIRSYMAFPYKLELNTELRFVGAIPGQEVPRYADGNVHMFRPITQHVKLAVTVENILHDNRKEWDYEDGLTLPRSIRAGIEWRF